MALRIKFKEYFPISIMLFLTREGKYVEINKSNYVNDIMYYQRIMIVRGYITTQYHNDTNNKLVDIVKRG